MIGLMRKLTIAAAPTKRAILVGLTVLAAAAPAIAAPAIIGDGQDSRCREALAMADTAFKSTSSSLLWPIPRPSGSSLKIILEQNSADISGGQAIRADGSAFEAYQLEGGASVRRTVFWRTKVSAGKRLAVVDTPFSWKGDWYTVFLLNSETSYDKFARQLIATDAKPLRALNPELGDNRWNPPLVLTDAKSGADWLIDRGEPYQIMADWQVRVVTEQGLATPCRIAFGYDERTGLAGMPMAVRKFAGALDEALGPGSNEGTMQSTAGIRIEVERGWANAALRPWALTDAPYNSRSEVERGLTAWARGNRSRMVLRRRIGKTHGDAELALTTYYVARLGMEPGAARNLSRQNIDHMFRAYFVFPKSS